MCVRRVTALGLLTGLAFGAAFVGCELAYWHGYRGDAALLAGVVEWPGRSDRQRAFLTGSDLTVVILGCLAGWAAWGLAMSDRPAGVGRPAVRSGASQPRPGGLAASSSPWPRWRGVPITPRAWSFWV